MRIALVSPYSWTYPGGVTRHIEALCEQLALAGHDPRVLAPFDPADRLSARLHRGARPEPRARPDYLIPLGRTVGLPANGAISNLALTPRAVSALRTELTTGGYDVVHVHEPNAPAISWDATGWARAPLVGTFHTYATNAGTQRFVAEVLGARRRYNRLRVRIAVSEASAWTARCFYGGRYRIIPNGVVLDPTSGSVVSDRDHALRVVFVGQAVERKGLPVLIRAFEALRERIPAKLTIIGAGEQDIAHLLEDWRGIEVLGKVSDERKRRCLAHADVLCAPSLGGESFGMVLTEAFAAGTPVVASDIAGYADVVEHGVDGLLVPRGDAGSLAGALEGVWRDADRRHAMAVAARASAQRYAWPRVAAQVLEAYEDAIAMPAPSGVVQRVAVRTGIRPADLGPTDPPRRLPPREPLPPARRRWLPRARRVGLALSLAAVVIAAIQGVARIGTAQIAASLLSSSPAWVLLALGLMWAAMALRALSWHAILRSALPNARVRARDALQGTFVGVLMSATLPARLGEPARALIVARRVGGARTHLATILGTLISQMLLNLVALLGLSIAMFTTVHPFSHEEAAMAGIAAVPLLLALAALLSSPLLAGRSLPEPAALEALVGRLRDAAGELRSSVRVFADARNGGLAAGAQLGAWGLQWMSCYALFFALGLQHQVGLGAAAAVLFAVNVAAALPLTPANLGIFQGACVAVLAAGYGVSYADALAYGIFLQAVELTTAVVIGLPALAREGLTWRSLRLRALHSTPVRLPARSERPRVAAAEADL